MKKAKPPTAKVVAIAVAKLMVRHKAERKRTMVRQIREMNRLLEGFRKRGFEEKQFGDFTALLLERLAGSSITAAAVPVSTAVNPASVVPGSKQVH